MMLKEKQIMRRRLFTTDVRKEKENVTSFKIPVYKCIKKKTNNIYGKNRKFKKCSLDIFVCVVEW